MHGHAEKAPLKMMKIQRRMYSKSETKKKLQKRLGKASWQFRPYYSISGKLFQQLNRFHRGLRCHS